MSIHRPDAEPVAPLPSPSPSRSTGEFRLSGSKGGPLESALPTPVLRTPGGTIQGIAMRMRSAFVTRLLNVTLAIVGIVLLAPVFLIVAALVRLTSSGPILYVQERVGLDRRSRRALALYDRRGQDLGGEVFTIYKFRSMYVDAERTSGAVWASANDPRVTPLGRFLRKTRLDEIPQLFNVLIGDMNLVGPRPERPMIVAQLRRDIAAYPLRHRAKPGITGLAQIHRCYDRDLDDVRKKLRYDLQYLRRQGVVEDVSIMLKTLPCMLFKRGW